MVRGSLYPKNLTPPGWWCLDTQNAPFGCVTDTIPNRSSVTGNFKKETKKKKKDCYKRDD